MIIIKEMGGYKKVKVTASEVIRCGTYCKCEVYEGPFCECTYAGECYYRDCMMKVLEAAKEKEGKDE